MQQIQFVSPETLGGSDAVVVDVREAAAYHDVGHVPDAVSIPPDVYRDPTGFAPGMLPDPDAITDALGAAGIDRSTPVIAYGADPANAARFLVTLAVLGHDADLGLVGHDVESLARAVDLTTESVDSDPATYESTDYDSPLLADRSAVEAASEGEAILLDTRTATEYDQGHIPGAIHCDVERLLSEGSVRPPDERAAVFEAVGLDPDTDIVLYCNTARRLSLVLVALLDAGYGDAIFYEGSLRDWLQAAAPTWDPTEIERIVREHASEGTRAVHDALGEHSASKLKLVGIYDQKQGGEHHMFRTKLPGGLVTADQARTLGAIAEEYAVPPASHDAGPFDGGYLDLTTRQGIQYHWIEMGDIPAIWDRLSAVGVSTYQSGGNSVRNVVANPAAGLAPDEVIDTRPVAEAVTEYFEADTRYANLPRKLKVSVAGSRQVSARPGINDLGFTPAKKDGRLGFNVHAGGGLSDSPRFADPLDVFVEPERVVDIVAATADLFVAQGSYLDTAVNRLRFLVEQWGVDTFRDELDRHYDGSLESAGTDLREGVRRDHVGVHEQGDGRSMVGLAVPVGRIGGSDLAAIADLAAEYGSGDLRITHNQNLLVADVPGDRVDALRASEPLEAYSPDPGPVTRGMVTCTGREYCTYALVETKARAWRWARELDATLDVCFDRVRVALSGCIASCAQPQLADVGLRGETRRDETDPVPHPAVDLAVGGDPANQEFARWLCGRIPIEDGPEAIARVIEAADREGDSIEAFVRETPAAELASIADPTTVAEPTAD
ncbi:rhodanese-like domain-containing protein [Halococcoides cellulosivorans]|uniref:Ferredoxin--nitrite reductase n=1 Tax=Halococcoides cellulosivorans TaxID=1679096 RepID=A0A2R4X236_9EURY|nr:rhodanese-like domain-containing protein [Halococcoides cellulosivorans]AWB27860.1 ferredoxin--nitrite reductase [Halococcoides cellulosivorans]